MRKTILSPNEKKVWHEYHIPGTTNLYRVKINAIFISMANGFDHEFAKFLKCYQLKKENKKFITEAEKSINRVKYRRDIINLTDNEIIEIETDPKRAQRFENDPETKKIEVIELWKGEPMNLIFPSIDPLKSRKG